MVRITHTNIIVDQFSTARNNPFNKYVHFLTHIHADHLKGLSNFWDYGPIYCSAITKSLILLKYPRLKCLKQLDLQKQYTIPLSSQLQITVTMFDANHCAGGVMLLLEGFMGTVLYTGDMRFDRQVFSQYTYLYPHVRRNKQFKKCSIDIDFLYLDTTFLHPKFSFPPKQQALKQLDSHIQETINKAKQQNKFIEFYIGIDSFGKEEVLVHLAQKFQTLVTVSEERYKNISLIGLDTDLFTTDPQAGFIHIVIKRELKQIIVEKQNALGVILTGWANNAHWRSAKTYAIPYSLHSSYPELVQFVDSIRPCFIESILEVGLSRQSNGYRRESSLSSFSNNHKSESNSVSRNTNNSSSNKIVAGQLKLASKYKNGENSTFRYNNFNNNSTGQNNSNMIEQEMQLYQQVSTTEYLNKLRNQLTSRPSQQILFLMSNVEFQKKIKQKLKLDRHSVEHNRHLQALSNAANNIIRVENINRAGAKLNSERNQQEIERIKQKIKSKKEVVYSEAVTEYTKRKQEIIDVSGEKDLDAGGSEDNDNRREEKDKLDSGQKQQSDRLDDHYQLQQQGQEMEYRNINPISSSKSKNNSDTSNNNKSRQMIDVETSSNQINNILNILNRSSQSIDLKQQSVHLQAQKQYTPQKQQQRLIYGLIEEFNQEQHDNKHLAGNNNDNNNNNNRIQKKISIKIAEPYQQPNFIIQNNNIKYKNTNYNQKNTDNNQKNNYKPIEQQQQDNHQSRINKWRKKVEQGEIDLFGNITHHTNSKQYSTHHANLINTYDLNLTKHNRDDVYLIQRQRKHQQNDQNNSKTNRIHITKNITKNNKTNYKQQNNIIQLISDSNEQDQYHQQNQHYNQHYNNYQNTNNYHSHKDRTNDYNTNTNTNTNSRSKRITNTYTNKPNANIDTNKSQRKAQLNILNSQNNLNSNQQIVLPRQRQPNQRSIFQFFNKKKTIPQSNNNNLLNTLQNSKNNPHIINETNMNRKRNDRMHNQSQQQQHQMQQELVLQQESAPTQMQLIRQDQILYQKQLQQGLNILTHPKQLSIFQINTENLTKIRQLQPHLYKNFFLKSSSIKNKNPLNLKQNHIVID